MGGAPRKLRNYPGKRNETPINADERWFLEVGAKFESNPVGETANQHNPLSICVNLRQSAVLFSSSGFLQHALLLLDTSDDSLNSILCSLCVLLFNSSHLDFEQEHAEDTEGSFEPSLPLIFLPE